MRASPFLVIPLRGCQHREEGQSPAPAGPGMWPSHIRETQLPKATIRSVPRVGVARGKVARWVMRRAFPFVVSPGSDPFLLLGRFELHARFGDAVPAERAAVDAVFLSQIQEGLGHDGVGWHRSSA